MKPKKALLDTNIIIHRENVKVTNQSIGLLYYWLDKLSYEKMIHPYSIQELKKYNDLNMQELYDVKMPAYTQMKTVAKQDDKFIRLLKNEIKTHNDEIDNQLLYELYSNKVDILITEDKKIHQNANILELSPRVFSINSFIEKCTSENPSLISYKVLSVKKEYIGNIDVDNVFFDSLKHYYVEFKNWFAKKSNEEAYICYTDTKDILGFLYLKTEGFDENYNITTQDLATLWARYHSWLIDGYKNGVR
uniref:PIN domain-containing protein n=1 Tax=Stomatohabitans albus TaxID=3110766 RepID=UPI00300D635D